MNPAAPLPEHRFSHVNHREYLSLLDRLKETWLVVFDGDSSFYEAHYLDLLAMMWWNEQPVRKTDAMEFMTGVKSPRTAAKYIETAVAGGIIEEVGNPRDGRSRLLSLTDTMRARMDGVMDEALAQLMEMAHRIDSERT